MEVSRKSDHSYHLAVVGGGLADLTAVALLGRAGKSVVVYERASNLRGRTATQHVEGFLSKWSVCLAPPSGCGFSAN